MKDRSHSVQRSNDGGENPCTCVYVGEALGRYHFGPGHPFGPGRVDAFWEEARRAHLDEAVHVLAPRSADEAMLRRFHSPEYIRFVKRQSDLGTGYLDSGDTPARAGIYEAACYVVGTTADACRRIMAGECRRAFIPVAGLHHGQRAAAAGFCVFNDCGVAIEMLTKEYGLSRIAYVDIDAHHGDGVFYAFEEEPRVFIADLHEDGRFLYPGTGAAGESGRGLALGTKLNIPMPPDCGDDAFRAAWARVEDFLHQARPQFILFQCGADSIAGDPLTHLRYTPAAHAEAARRLCAIADEHGRGRLLAMGGGGYDYRSLALAWTGVLAALVEADDPAGG
jgi:acetoin utilization protein AcuC